MDHLLKRHDVPSREDDVLPDSSVHAEQNPGPSTAEKEQEATEEVSTNTEESNTGSQARRSQRTRRTPEYLKDYVTV